MKNYIALWGKTTGLYPIPADQVSYFQKEPPLKCLMISPENFLYFSKVYTPATISWCMKFRHYLWIQLWMMRISSFIYSHPSFILQFLLSSIVSHCKGMEYYFFGLRTMGSTFQCLTFKAEDIFTSSFPLPIHPFYFPTPFTILRTFPLLSVTIIILCLVYTHISQTQLHIRVTLDCWKIVMPKSDPQSSDLIHLKKFSVVTIKAPQRF